MQLNKVFRRRHAVVLTAEDLRRFHESLKSSVGALSYRCMCSDGAQLRPQDLDDLLAYENPPFRRIQRLTISATSADLRKDVQVTFGPGDYPFEGTIEGSLHFADHRDSKHVEDDLLQRLRLLSPWYSFLSRLSFALLFPALILLIPLGRAAGTLIAKSQGYLLVEEASQLTENEAFVGFAVVLGVFAAFGLVADKFRAYFFPSFVTLIGRGKLAHQKAQAILKVVFGVIGLGIVINILSSLLLK